MSANSNISWTDATEAKPAVDIAWLKERLGRVSESGKWALAGLTYDELRDVVGLLERLTAERDAMRAVVEAARGVDNCMDPSKNGDMVWYHDNGCLGTLTDALARLDAARQEAAHAH